MMSEEIRSSKRWNELIQEINEGWYRLGCALTECLMPAIEQLVQWYENYRRTALALRLGGSKFAWWIANHWPKRWLPTLDFPNEKNQTD